MIKANELNEEKIRALRAGITAPPWKFEVDYHWLVGSGDEETIFHFDPADSQEIEKRDAEFIAAAPEIVDYLLRQKEIADALMLEGSQRIEELRDERDRLKEHVRDLNADMESSNRHCDEHHVSVK